MSSKKEKTDISISIIVILIALAFILFYSLSGDTSFLVSEQKIDTIDTLVIEAKTYTRTDETEIQDEVSEAEEVDTSSSVIDTLVAFPSQDSLISETNSIEENSSKITNDESTSEPLIRTFDFNESEEKGLENIIESETTVIDSQLKVEKIERDDLEKNCVILVGSFTNSKNANKLKNQLKKDGYEIFEVPYKNLIRIGIYSYCEKLSINKELSVIRSKYATDAVIYTPK